jgi:mannose-6-phosphate isomerase-like protein (cupin superfamily)
MRSVPRPSRRLAQIARCCASGGARPITQPNVSRPIRTGVRRVTTAVDAKGRAIVLRDETVHGDPLGLLVWGADLPPRVGDGSEPAMSGWWPPPGGVRVSLSTRAPDADADSLRREPGPWPDIDDLAGFHASPSVDVIVMISGRIWLELDDGVEVVLEAGDVLVQNGTRHRWRNRGDEWPLMAVIIVGAALVTY